MISLYIFVSLYILPYHCNDLRLRKRKKDYFVLHAASYPSGSVSDSNVIPALECWIKLKVQLGSNRDIVK